MQLPAIRVAREDGMYSIVADGNAHCPGRDTADAFEHVDLNDLEGMADVATRHRVNGVCTAGTDFSTTVAWVAEKLGLPGIDYETALRAKDKAIMRRALQDGGILVPPFRIYRNGVPADDTIEVPFPAVVKPVDNMGARGVQTVTREADLSAAIEKATAASQCGRVILESFIPGPEYSIDAISYRGTVTPCGVGDRHIGFPPYFVETGHTIPSALSPARLGRLESGFAQAVKVLGIDPGAAKGDVFLVPPDSAPGWLIDRAADSESSPASRRTGRAMPDSESADDFVVIGEIAARLSGGYMSGWTYPLSRGYEPVRAAIRIAVGDDPGEMHETKNRYSAERAIISIPGTIDHFERPEETRTAADELFLTRQAGDRVSLPTSNVEKCGNLIYVDETYEAAAAGADELRHLLGVRLRVPDAETDRFLFGRASPELSAWDGATGSERGIVRALEEHASTRIDSLLGAPERANEARASSTGSTGGPHGVDAWLSTLQARYASHSAVVRDIRNRTRYDCIDLLSEVWRGTSVEREYEHQSEIIPDPEVFVELCVLAIERGGLQGTVYFIDTISEPEGAAKLWKRVRSIRSSDCRPLL